MNKEVIKAMNKKPATPNRFKKWWRKNDYKVRRIIFFLIWVASLIIEKINHYIDSLNAWDETRANEILSYYVPRYADWNAEKREFYFFDNGYGWCLKLAKRHLKMKDRRFWKVNSGTWGWKMRDYLINNFELEGFTKEVAENGFGYTEIIFKENKENA